MAEYITKEQVLEWFRPYGHTDEPIPFETLAADLRDCIPAADVAPVRHGKWIKKPYQRCSGRYCSVCDCFEPNERNYCPDCGAKMDGGKDDG